MFQQVRDNLGPEIQGRPDGPSCHIVHALFQYLLQFLGSFGGRHKRDNEDEDERERHDQRKKEPNRSPTQEQAVFSII